MTMSSNRAKRSESLEAGGREHPIGQRELTETSEDSESKDIWSTVNPKSVLFTREKNTASSCGVA